RTQCRHDRTRGGRPGNSETNAGAGCRSRRRTVRKCYLFGGRRMTTLPLDGIRVIDFTQVMLGPSCTQVLADYGAEVIKVEKERIGDLSRWSLGSDPDGLNNPVFCSLNRNKKSLALDLKQPEARDTVLTLLETADVVVNNFRPGVMERMGFGFE